MNGVTKHVDAMIHDPMVVIRLFACLVGGLVWLGAALASAHGINGHVHVTGWAVEHLPPGPLADFLSEPEVFDALLLGATFPDSGYAIEDDYGELAHWPPFAEGCLADLRARYPLPWDTLVARKHAAFVMGIALHGLQDEIFDTLFLRQVERHDGRGQDDTDPGLDGFLYTDGHLRFSPEYYVPAEILAEVFAEVHGHIVSRATIEAGVTRVKLIVIDAFGGIGPRLDEVHRPRIPWAAAHYLDPDVPGSLRSEIPATMAFLAALWDRTHGTWAQGPPVAYTSPSPPRRLRSAAPDGVDHWITLVLGAAVRAGTLTPERVRLVDGLGQAVPIRVRASRWARDATSGTRLVVLEPLDALAYDAIYGVELHPGLEFFNGATPPIWRATFRTPCAVEAPCDDPDVGVLSIDPPPDAAPSDGGAPNVAGGRDAIALAAETGPSRSGASDPAPETGCSAGGAGDAAPWVGLLLLLVCGRARGRASHRR